MHAQSPVQADVGRPVHINMRKPAGTCIVRKELSMKLHAWLDNSDRHRIAVWGLGGSGKSTLAMRFLCDQVSKYKVVAFLRRSNLPEDYLKLAKDLFSSSSSSSSGDLDHLKPCEVRDKVHGFLKWDVAHRWVIALDDVVSLDEEMLEGFPWDYGKTLVTTRDQLLDEDGKGVSVGSFNVDEACRYVLDVVPWWGRLDQECIVSFVQRLHLFPLAITHALQYCKSVALQVPEEYFQSIKNVNSSRQHSAKSKSAQKLDEYPDVFEDVVHLSVSKIIEQDVDAAEATIELLKMFSYLNPSEITIELFRCRQCLDKELDLLRSQSFVTIDDATGSVVMHPLTQTVIRESVKQSATHKCLLFVAQALLAQSNNIDTKQHETFHIGRRYSPHVMHLIAHLDPLKDMGQGSELLDAIVQLSRNIGMFLDVSVSMYEEALQCFERLHGILSQQPR